MSQQNLKNMRQFRIAFFFLAALLCSSNLFAQTFSIKDKDCNVLFFNVLDVNKKTVELTYAPTIDSGSYVQPKGTLTIPKSVLFDGKYYDVISLGCNALKGMNELHTVILPSTLLKICDNAFLDCTSLEVIQMPAHNIKISKTAFTSCVSLRDVKFGANWTLIDCHPFSDCKSIETLNIPGKVSTVLGLNELQSLSYISVDETNESLASVAGMLFNKSKSELLYCPRNYSLKVIVPEGTELIRTGAMENCLWLESIQLPSTLKTLSFLEFSNMRNLKSLTILSDKPILNSIIDGKKGFALYVSSNVNLYVKRSSLREYQDSTLNEEGVYVDVYTGKTRKCKSVNLIKIKNIKTVKRRS